MLNSIKASIARSLFRYSSDITMLLGITAAVLAGGFLFYNSTINIGLIQLMPYWAWALFFSIYGLLKLVESYKCLPHYLAIFVSIAGIWSWSYLLVLFTIVGMAPVNSLILIPLICEIWALTSRLFNNGCKV